MHFLLYLWFCYHSWWIEDCQKQNTLRDHCNRPVWCRVMQQSNGTSGSFATPLPVKPRPTPANHNTPSAVSDDRCGTLRREFASTQSLVLDRAHRLVSSVNAMTFWVYEGSSSEDVYCSSKWSCPLRQPIRVIANVIKAIQPVLPQTSSFVI